MAMARDQIFVSYSHKDKKWLERLQRHLTPFVRNGLEVWDDTRIKPGSNWKDEIVAALERAKVAVLLVSPHFLASEFIARHELAPLLEAASKDGLVILWIAVSTSAYEETEIARYQAAHDPSIALDRRGDANWNKDMVAICRKIKESTNP
jgi:internalin A